MCSTEESNKVATSSPTDQLEEISCDVCVIGGGIAGLYISEWLLREEKEQSVCIVETEGRLGGRINDHVFAAAPNVSVALGAYRIGVKHTHVMSLLKRFDIPYEEWDHELPLLCVARGVVSSDMDDLMEKVFPQLKLRNMSAEEMYKYILDPVRRQTAKDFSNIRQYIEHYLGEEEADFLLSRFTVPGDMEGFINTRDCLNFIDACLKSGSKYVRPVKGMLALVETLATTVQRTGGRVLLKSSVAEISRAEDSQYAVTCNNAVITARKIVITVPPKPFRKITGSLAEEIQNHPVFQSIGHLDAVKAAAVYTEQWWLKELNNGHSLRPLQMLVSKDNLGKIIPYRGVGPNGEGILQTVYMEGALWGSRKDMNKDDILKYIHSSLQEIFPNVEVPRPLETVYKYWSDGAVHSIKQGSNVTVPQLIGWSKRPFPGEEVYLAGEAYGPGLGWTESALISAAKVLEEGWGIPDPYAFRR